MSGRAGPTAELQQPVPFPNRRDSRSRTSIEACLAFFSKRRTTFIQSYDSKTAIRDPKAAGPADSINMAYPQISRPTQSFQDGSDIPGRQIRKEMDVEVASIDPHKHDEPHVGALSMKHRLKHFTFAWYTWTMSTGGVAFVLSVIPTAYRFSGLSTLGTVIFVANLFFFTFTTLTICARFIIHPGTLTHALTNPHEGFFFATFWLSLATMITNSTAYGIPNTGPWLITALRIAFWICTVCATLLEIFYYHVLFTVKRLVITNVLPGWVLPIFPAMLVGTLASAIAKTQPAEHATVILVAGLSYQGLGFFVALMMYGIYFGRLLTSGLPIDTSRPTMFIAVGPPSFSALAFIGMGQDVVAVQIFSTYTPLPGIVNQAMIPDFLQLIALVSAIFLWTLAFWFFAIALVATIEAVQRNDFHLNWYAYVFPNVGFTIATVKIRERLNSPAIQGIGTGMAAVLFVLWLFIMVCHVRAIVQKKICWPGKDEDAH